MMVEYLNLYFLRFLEGKILKFNPLIPSNFVPKIRIIQPLVTPKMAEFLTLYFLGLFVQKFLEFNPLICRHFVQKIPVF